MNHESDFYNDCGRGIIHNVDVFDEQVIDTGFRLACNFGQLNVVKWLVSKGAEDIEGFNIACSQGHLDIVQYLVSIGKGNYNYGLINACTSSRSNSVDGLLKVAEFLLSKGANNYGEALYSSFIHHKQKIIELLISNRGGVFSNSNPVCWFSSKTCYKLLEMGVLIESFAENDNCKNLIKEIQEFKTRALSATRDMLIPELSKLILDYSLK